MRKYIKIAFILLIATTGLSSCIEDTYKVTFKGAQAEFDATVWNTLATGLTHPMLTKIAPYNRPVAAANPDLTRASGSIVLRVNLISKHLSSDQVLDVTVITAGTTAVSGTHYTVPATVTIPAGQSFGLLTVTIIDPGASSATPADLILELGGNGKVEAAENFKRVGLRISQI